jgi:hypothetical protein
MVATEPILQQLTQRRTTLGSLAEDFIDLSQGNRYGASMATSGPISEQLIQRRTSLPAR